MVKCHPFASDSYNTASKIRLSNFCWLNTYNGSVNDCAVFTGCSGSQSSTMHRLLSDVDSTCVSVRQSASEQLCEAMDHRLGKLATVRHMWDIERSAGTVYPPRTKPAACTQHSAVTSHWTRSETWSHMHTHSQHSIGNVKCQQTVLSTYECPWSFALAKITDPSAKKMRILPYSIQVLGLQLSLANKKSHHWW